MFIYFLLYKLVGFSFFLMPNEFTLGFIVFTVTYMPTVHSAKCCSYELCKSAGETSTVPDAKLKIFSFRNYKKNQCVRT